MCDRGQRERCKTNGNILSCPIVSRSGTGEYRRWWRNGQHQLRRMLVHPAASELNTQPLVDVYFLPNSITSWMLSFVSVFARTCCCIERFIIIFFCSISIIFCWMSFCIPLKKEFYYYFSTILLLFVRSDSFVWPILPDLHAASAHVYIRILDTYYFLFFKLKIYKRDQLESNVFSRLSAIPLCKIV